jgi:fermentation-respiration switch protein FrsA (DUF1100 family)
MIALILISTSAVAAAALALLGGTALLVLYPFVPPDLGGAPNLDRRARRLRIPVAGNDWIAGWHLPGSLKALVIIFHGYGRNHYRAWRYGAFLNQVGYHVLTVDFRSSRVMGRKPTTLGHFEQHDAQATLDWVRSQPEFAGLKIGVFGESLGGAVALRLADANPDVAAVVADGAFANARDAIEDSCERWARLPRWPSAEILCSFARAVTGCDPAAVDPVSAAGRLRERPVLFIHGLKDNRLSPGQVERLWVAAGEKDPLWVLPEAGHNEGWIKQRDLYESRVLAFYNRHLLGVGEGLPAGQL